MHPHRTTVSVRLTTEELADLDELCELVMARKASRRFYSRRAISRSAALREGIESALAHERELAEEMAASTSTT